ncbi:MAG: dihydrodipicolinate synthase family protein [Gemmatimonadaceae bacterium]
MSVSLKGVFAPVISTFSPANGELDTDGFSANVRAHLDAGLHGIVVTGSTGEAALLDATERGKLIDATRALVPSDKTLIVGTGAESTRTCLQLTRDAAGRGADAVLVVAPHYYSSAMTTPALERHYRAVADASPVPVILYNIPKYMHFALAAELVADLAKHGNIIGVKDSSGNRDLFASYMAAQSNTFSVLTGNAQMFHHALQTGAPGGILAVSLFAAALTLDVFETHIQGDTVSAEALQARMTPLGAKIVGELGVAGVKAAMDRVGLAGGPVRSPLSPLDAAGLATVEALLRGAEVATAV